MNRHAIPGLIGKVHETRLSIASHGFKPNRRKEIAVRSDSLSNAPQSSSLLLKGFNLQDWKIVRAVTLLFYPVFWMTLITYRRK